MFPKLRKKVVISGLKVVLSPGSGGVAEATLINGREALGKELRSRQLALEDFPPDGGGDGSAGEWGMGGAPRGMPEEGASKGACASSVCRTLVQAWLSPDAGRGWDGWSRLMADSASFTRSANKVSHSSESGSRSKAREGPRPLL